MHEPHGQPVTILFTDVQGSTQLRARHGDRVADEILHDHEGIVRRAIDAHGGVEVAFLGDGFMATFDAPAAGLRCAIAIQQALQQYGRDNADRRIRVRIGLHHGAAVQRDGSLYGQAVNAAARVMGEAVGGRIGLIFVDGHSDFRHPGNASYVGAAAGEDLGLDHGRRADLLRDPPRLGGRGREAVRGDGDARLLHDLAGFVFEEPHG